MGEQLNLHPRDAEALLAFAQKVRLLLGTELVGLKLFLAHDVYISPRVIAQAVLDDPLWKITPFLEVVEKEGVPL